MSNHTRVLSMMMTHAKGKKLVHPVITKFATNFIALQCIVLQELALKRMFVAYDWTITNPAKTP